MADALRIALVDDDDAVLDALRLYFSSKGLESTGYASADIFLAAGPADTFDCIVADVRMPGTDGMDLVRRLAAERSRTPVVLITGHGDIDMAVAAIKLGAADFIEKPFDEARLLEAILGAVALARRERDADLHRAELHARYDSLSDRQRQVLELATGGLSNKEIAQRLGISSRTVEIHRAWMMTRMGAGNLAQLVRMEMELKAKR
ncbi:MAG: response regulator [Alphaproteobacteria bacterium]|nr:response regulator [Alphaproteobacteria bacterium]